MSDVFEEGRHHLVHSSLIYLLADARNLSDTGYTPFEFRDLCVESDVSGMGGIRDEKIFASILKILRAEVHGEKDGLVGPSLYKDRGRSEGLVQALDRYIEVSLEDPGDQVSLCSRKTRRRPLQWKIESHQHVGSSDTCLCTKFGMHYTQVLIDHILRTEEEKREREKIAVAQRAIPNALARCYQQFAKSPPPEPTEQQKDEDKQVDEVISRAMNALKKQLKDGSFLKTVLSDDSRTTWINDKHPDRECVYAVSVNSEEKTVTVSFRGTVNLENWVANFQAKLVKRINPIEDPYENKTDYILLHEGFSAYLLRRRKDNGLTKFDEIVNAVATCADIHIGKDEYRLIITGHSLGGALAVIFGLYMSAQDRLARKDKAPLDIFTACAPPSGDITFLRAFRHQELSGNLRHIRFFNKWDLVPHIPPNVNYLHVGVGVMLHNRVGSSPKIMCISDFDRFWPMLLMMIREFFLWTVLFFKTEYHSIDTIISNIGNAIDFKRKKKVPSQSIDEVYDKYVFSAQKKAYVNGHMHSNV